LFEGFTVIARRWRRALFILKIDDNLYSFSVSTLLGVHLTNRCMSKVHASICSTTYVQPYGPRGLCHSQIPSATPPRLLRELERASSRRLRKSQEDYPTFHLPSEPNNFYNASHKLSISGRRITAMLASPFYTQTQTPPTTYRQREFLPKIPSPLSPRSANIHGNGSTHAQQPIFMTGTENPSDKSQTSLSALPYAKRAIKKAPVVSQDALKERRRGMFLKKVREGREDKRFERHGEDVCIPYLSRVGFSFLGEEVLTIGHRSCAWTLYRGKRNGKPSNYAQLRCCLPMGRKRKKRRISVR
jgi:hypothetical protein